MFHPARTPLGTGSSGWARTGTIPSAYPISRSIPSEIMPKSFLGGRLTTKRACFPLISAGSFRSPFMPTRTVLLWSPKSTLSETSLSDPETSVISEIVPTLMSSLSRSSEGSGLLYRCGRESVHYRVILLHKANTTTSERISLNLSWILIPYQSRGGSSR